MKGALLPLALWAYLLPTSFSLVSKPNQFDPINDQLLELPPENKQNWAHPVIFEPQPKIQLTRSSYQVMTFLDFAPYIDGFNRVRRYIENYCYDLENPAYFNRIIQVSTNNGPSPLLNDQDLLAFHASNLCKHLPFECSTKLKIDCYKIEIEYLYELFSTTYHKFLNAIDHIDFHPSNLATSVNSTRMKRATWLKDNGFYYPYPFHLTPSKEKLLNCLLDMLKLMNLKLRDKLSRVKRFGIMMWILGWGVYSNSHSIRKIKQNLRDLQDQNILQDEQIKELAKHLNLTMTQVN